MGMEAARRTMNAVAISREADEFRGRRSGISPPVARRCADPVSTGVEGVSRGASNRQHEAALREAPVAAPDWVVHEAHALELGDRSMWHTFGTMGPESEPTTISAASAAAPPRLPRSNQAGFIIVLYPRSVRMLPNLRPRNRSFGTMPRATSTRS